MSFNGTPSIQLKLRTQELANSHHTCPKSTLYSRFIRLVVDQSKSTHSYMRKRYSLPHVPNSWCVLSRGILLYNYLRYTCVKSTSGDNYVPFSGRMESSLMPWTVSWVKRKQLTCFLWLNWLEPSSDTLTNTTFTWFRKQAWPMQTSSSSRPCSKEPSNTPSTIL